MPSEAFEMRGLLCARTLPHLPHEPCTLQGTLRASTLFPSNAENFFKYCKVLATIIPIYGNVPNFPFLYLDFVHYVRVLIKKKLIFRRQEKNPREQRSGNAARAWPKLLQPTKFGSDRRSAIYGRVYFPLFSLFTFISIEHLPCI